MGIDVSGQLRVGVAHQHLRFLHRGTTLSHEGAVRVSERMEVGAAAKIVLKSNLGGCKVALEGCHAWHGIEHAGAGQAAAFTLEHSHQVGMEGKLVRPAILRLLGPELDKGVRRIQPDIPPPQEFQFLSSEPGEGSG